MILYVTLGSFHLHQLDVSEGKKGKGKTWQELSGSDWSIGVFKRAHVQNKSARIAKGDNSTAGVRSTLYRRSSAGWVSFLSSYVLH